ncbi:hypothetical protein Lser_V15G38240 [Lactuca serriola]
MSKAYSTAAYVKEEERISIKVFEKKTSITKTRFSSLLGLANDETLINPYSISTAQIIDMFSKMGYTYPIPSITKFKKSNLPPLWSGLFTHLFKAFLERVSGSDCASKSFMTIIYGLFHGISLNCGSVLWDQLVQSTNSTTRHNKISLGRFWSIVVQRAITKLNIPVMADLLKSLIATFHTMKIVATDNSKFAFVGSIPESMYKCVSGASKLIREYKNRQLSGPRILTQEKQQTLDEADKIKKGGKPKQPKEGPLWHPQFFSRSEKDRFCLCFIKIRVPF